MIASTRFRRLFASSSGYVLFMPAVIKVYCEAETQPGVRSAIRYAVHRFFALHDKAFVFQTLEAASFMIRHPSLSEKGVEEWFSSNFFSLLAALSALCCLCSSFLDLKTDCSDSRLELASVA